MKDSEKYRECPVCKRKTFLMSCCGKLITKNDKNKRGSDVSEQSVEGKKI